jgi:hypothetical protein
MYITLGEIAAKTDQLIAVCSKCARCGRYNVARLIEKYAPGKSGPELLRELSVDCPGRNNTGWHDRCDPHCPELPALFGRRT